MILTFFLLFNNLQSILVFERYLTYICILNINNKFQIIIKSLFNFDIIAKTFFNSSYAHINNISLLLLNHLRDL